MDPESLLNDEGDEVEDQDPDAQYLEGDEGQETDEQRVAREEKERREQDPPIDAETRAILSKLRENPGAMERLLNPTENRQAPPPERPAPVDPDAFAAKFEEDFMRDPKTAIKGFMGAVASVVEQAQARTREEMQQQFAPVMGGQADSAIDTYMERSRNDALMDDDVRSEMNHIIEVAKKNNGAVIARMSREQIMSALDSAKAEAIGRVAMKRSSSRKSSANPPNYGGAGNTRPQGKAPKFTAEERGLIRSLESAGVDKKDITQALKEFRAERSA